MKKYCEISGVEIPSDETHAISTDELKAAIEKETKDEALIQQIDNGYSDMYRHGFIQGVFWRDNYSSIAKELIELREEIKKENATVLFHFKKQRELEKQIQTLTAENEKLREENAENKTVNRLYHDLCHEWNEECEYDCSSYGHSENCRNVYLGEAKRAMQKQIQTLTEAIHIAVDSLTHYVEGNGDGWMAKAALTRINALLNGSKQE